MACIDKTYTDSYKEYKEFKDWADTQYLTFYDGLRVRIGDWVWERSEEDFENGDIPIMNTPTWLDVYLIQNCKSEFVLERMKWVYDEEDYQKFLSVDLTAKPPKEFQQNRKIVIKRNKRSKFPIHNKPYFKGAKWWIQCYDNFWYNDKTGVWSSDEGYYPRNTNTSHMKSLKALVRHLRKQYLPKGITFSISGRYVGESYDAVIK